MDPLPCSCFTVNTKNQQERTVTGKRSKLWSLSVQVKSGKKNITPLLAPISNPPFQKTQNGG